MHEASTGQTLADLVLKEAKKHNAARVLRVEVEIGELSFLEPDQISFWMEAHFRDTIAQGAALDIKLVEAQVHCDGCGYAGKIETQEDPTYHLMLPHYACPQCGSPRLEVERGRECILRRVEMELPEE